MIAQGAEAGGSTDFLAMWAGQAAPLARELPAADLVARIVTDAKQLLAALAD